jgi:4'-phosphopantetheinyl transferase
MPALFTPILSINDVVNAAHGVNFLTASERDLLSCRTNIKQQHNFIAGRWVLKNLLMQDMGGSFLDWCILPSPTGAPKAFLHGELCAAGVSISHSSTMVLAGLNHAGELGVDIEELRPRACLNNLADLVTYIATKAELNWWHAQVQPLAAFYQLWCAKEAVGKLRGTGLTGATLRTESLIEINNTQWRTADGICITHLTTAQHICAVAKYGA